MASIPDSLADAAAAARPAKPAPWGTIALVAVAALLALWFIRGSVLGYLLHYGPEQFGPYWARRASLLVHISAGSVAILLAVWQLWSGLAGRPASRHRWLGRAYLAAVTLGSLAAFSLALTPSFGWTYGAALMGLALAWSGTAWTAWYAMRLGDRAMHRRWMIRAFVVTFAFVFYRMITMLCYANGLGTVAEQNQFAAWACWAFPLLLTLLGEGVADARKRKAVRARAALSRG